MLTYFAHTNEGWQDVSNANEVAVRPALLKHHMLNQSLADFQLAASSHCPNLLRLSSIDATGDSRIPTPSHDTVV